jgi:NAD(P)-dependent dehydrogenase (short-subunit alcohol dehydrogenase family)
MTSDTTWANKVVLITGGGGGMGRAIAARFLGAGGAVALADLDGVKAAAAAAEVGAGSGRALGVGADVTKVADCRRMIDETVAKFGRLDVLICAAGIWTEGRSDEATEAEWDRVIDVNLKGTFFACRYAIPALEKTGGLIINISSDAGIIGNAGAAIYCASKGGVSVMTKALALELAPRGVRAVAICPGDVDTPMIDYQANTFGGGDPEGYKRALLAKYPQGPRARFIRTDEVAELVFAVSSPSLAPLTGACVLFDFGISAGV